jgi:hypothetical protein
MLLRDSNLQFTPALRSKKKSLFDNTGKEIGVAPIIVAEFLINKALQV